MSIGNAQFPFSREDMTSSKKQQLVERTFVGDHNYGTPERNAGIYLHYAAMDKMLELHLAGGNADIDPDAAKRGQSCRPLFRSWVVLQVVC